jgi:membrane-bound lytic murein transglycosylase MltF
MYRIRRGLVMAITVLGVLSLFSCGGETEGRAPAGRESGRTPATTPTSLANDSISGSGGDREEFLEDLSPRGLQALESIRDRGVLRAAVIESPESYAPTAATEKQGLDYRLVQEFARTLGVSLSVGAGYTVQQFFSRDGTFPEEIFTDPGLTYAPDGFETFDIFAAPLAIVPWRTQIARMVPIYPAGISIVGPHAGSIETETDLDGLSVTVIEGEFQITLLEGVMDEHGITINFVYREQGENGYDTIRAGEADIVLDGSVFVASGIEELAEMEVAPLALSRVAVGWAVPKNDRGLYDLLTRYIETALADGTVARIWRDTHGVAFDTYIDLIGLE